jgi:ABC-type Mn2+/Zn2+ transport system permease subunit
VPAVCGVTLARKWSGRLLVGWVVAVAASLIGLATSYLLDLPTGAAIVVACGLLLVLVNVIASVRGTEPA